MSGHLLALANNWIFPRTKKNSNQNGIFTVLTVLFNCALHDFSAVNHNGETGPHHSYQSHLHPLHLQWQIFSLCSMTQLIQSRRPVNFKTVYVHYCWSTEVTYESKRSIRVEQHYCNANDTMAIMIKTLIWIYNGFQINLLTAIKAQLPK